MATSDAQRVTRARDRAMIKRNTCILRITAIHALAKRVTEDGSITAQLIVAAQDLDMLWADFIAEDNAVLEALCDLGLQAEYSGALVVEIRELMIYAKSVANQYTDMTGSTRETRSRPGSVISEPLESNKELSGLQDPIGLGSVARSRLPEIPLPQFDGNIYKWPAFRDRFVALVADQIQLSDIEKMYYLIGCLKGSAAEIAQSIPVSADTYKLLWNALENKFDKPRLVASSFVEKLLSAPMATNESLASLTKFISIFDEGVSVLKSLMLPDLGDFILFTLASRCLPVTCRTLFEATLGSEYPSADALVTFIKSRIAILEHVSTAPFQSPPHRPRLKEDEIRRPHRSMPVNSLVTSNMMSLTCKCCSGAHSLSDCSRFKGWSINARVKWVREHRMCFLCLSDKHWSNRCRSKVTCPKCSRKHHVLIHEEKALVPSNSPPTPAEKSIGTSAASLCGYSAARTILLGTALVHIRDCSGVLHTVRALVDSASQISAITTNCATRLGLKRTPWTASVSGLSGTIVHDIEGLVSCHVQPRFSDDPIVQFQAWVLSSITTDMPRQELSQGVVAQFAHLALADPTFLTPSPIDVLLGADVFASILDGKRVEVGDNLPVAFGSIFGWILIGPILGSNHPSVADFHSIPVSLTTSIQYMMDRFWQVEEPERAPEEFTDEGKCEIIFQNGHQRSADGRFSVPLPFRCPPSEETFQGSRSTALRRFENLERKFTSNPQLRDSYKNFMSEYLSLGHMSLATSPGHYFIPHHAVFKTLDPQSKIRVVFDASATSFTGKSLNHCLFTGPKLQRDVVDILLLFRLPRHAFTTDICKMYRQILVTPSFRRFQHIFWRESPLEKLQEYELNTVTYGVNCSPYLAMRVLQSIADNDCVEFPAVREALLTQTYVDDVCSGADTEEEILQLQSALISVLQKAGFELKKWSSNSKTVLNRVPECDRACSSIPFKDSDGVGIKVLGLQWNHSHDMFCYILQQDTVILTKRGMLSLIARIFDPLGLLAPTVFLAKHLMQRVWVSKLGWDDPLPAELAESWGRFVADLPVLSQLKISRFVGTRVKQKCVLCGFCDASERGYAAVVYIRVEGIDGKPIVSLLGTKSKLAPLKSISIPRLELCAALLLARWLHRIQGTIQSKLNIVSTMAWTDSSVVLNWLTVSHQSFKIFVSNRINQIHTLLPGCQWNYIRSKNNPADCVSRGISPSELINHILYWNGPSFLLDIEDTWSQPMSIIPVDQLPEIKLPPPVVLTSSDTIEWYTRFSSYDRILRVVSWMRRFLHACQHHDVIKERYLTRNELDSTAQALIRVAQQLAFPHIIRELRDNLPVSSRLIARLRPFINTQDILCVGGRLRNSDLPPSQRFPVLLPKSSHFSVLIIRHWHRVTCHGGSRVISTLVGRQFWILSMRSLIRRVISKCTRCVRVSAVNPQPIMADLPRSRITECRPFSRVGIDFAGPLLMKETRLRKPREYKVYVAVYVCFVIKAVHLEVVSDLTTSSFLASLDRFVARRGIPTDIYSDCGSNFLGASKQLHELFKDSSTRHQVSSAVSCTWHFNPPSAPHFGGLWEAAVRSAKSLLVKEMGEHKFTLEELTTVLCRIEAILNSRPLTPASSDPTDLECLTPGHFLIGQPLLAIPEREEGIPTKRLSFNNRWKLLHQCVQAFWRRWRGEYLQTLQVRGRWASDQPSLLIDDMVIIKENHTPPLTWPLGRITEIMPGSDGVVRVARVRTQQGSFIRPIVKLVKLPIVEG